MTGIRQRAVPTPCRGSFIEKDGKDRRLVPDRANFAYPKYFFSGRPSATNLINRSERRYQTVPAPYNAVQLRGSNLSVRTLEEPGRSASRAMPTICARTTRTPRAVVSSIHHLVERPRSHITHPTPARRRVPGSARRQARGLPEGGKSLARRRCHRGPHSRNPRRSPRQRAPLTWRSTLANNRGRSPCLASSSAGSLAE